MTAEQFESAKPDQPRADAITVLTLYAVLLISLPSSLVVGPLGAAGSPASLFAIGCLLWWTWDALRRAEPVSSVEFYPIRLTAGLLALCVALSYVVAMRRPINAAEASTADIGMLSFAGWMGILLLAHDGVRDMARLHVLIRRLSTLGGLLAALGILQFVTGQAIVDMINIPGLTNNEIRLVVGERNGFNRPSATAIHAIEFSVVITMLLPLALVSARLHDGRTSLRRWLPAALMISAVPLAISRSAIVGALVGLVIMIPALPSLHRRLLLASGGLVAVGTFLAVPGLLGSTLRLFTGITNDGSARSRTDSYQIVWEYFTRYPFFGRGFSTFLPSHRILDNQYLLLLLDIGLFGLCAMLGLLLVGVGCALAARRHSSVPMDRELAQAIVASIMVGAVGFALFDGLSFPMAAGVLFVTIGLSGALWRMVRTDASYAPRVEQPLGSLR